MYMVYLLFSTKYDYNYVNYMVELCCIDELQGHENPSTRWLIFIHFAILLVGKH